MPPCASKAVSLKTQFKNEHVLAQTKLAETCLSLPPKRIRAYPFWRAAAEADVGNC